jgi:2-methylisocitrate lyase-like PEP mutase family enzyme
MTDRSARFRELHNGPEILVLPNAWDGGSARLMESLGAKAIATTSAGVAWAHGYPDGDKLPVELHAATIRDIERAVGLPVTVDAEGGYGQDRASVGEAIGRLIDAGAIGINIEDGHETPERTCVKIEAAKEAASRAGIDLFVNTRTDVFLRSLAPGREVEEILARASLYAKAGCDGIFTPGAMDRETIGAIARGLALPLNVMAVPGLPPAAELYELGVRRLSAGSAIAQAAWGLVRKLSADYLDGRDVALFADALSYGDLNGLMAH